MNNCFKNDRRLFENVDIETMSMMPRDSSYPEHLANSVNSTDIALRALYNHARSPIQYLPIYILIYIFSLFTRGLLGCLWAKTLRGHLTNLTANSMIPGKFCLDFRVLEFKFLVL